MPHRQPTVLVVDDEAGIRELFAKILESGGYVAVTAGSAETALDLIHRGTVVPDGILLDLKMPGMGGWAFLVQMRSDPAYASVPVAIVTGDSYLASTLTDVARVLNTEVHFKPLNIDDVLDLAARLIELRA